LIFFFSLFSHLLWAQNTTEQSNRPLRIGVVGLTHAHVHWILGRPKADDIEIVGIAEPNKALAEKFAQRHGYSMSIVFSSLDEMVQKTKPEAVTAFNSIYEHLETVEYCAPKGIHVMVEKPLAVSYEHAQKMVALAKKHHIFLLTNYETTWYRSNEKAYQLIKEGTIGEIRKMVFHYGHPGPIEIGCNKEFLDFLTDPKLNGAGALTDFGCYGTNLATWLLDGQKPIAVSCVTHQIKPHLYPKVDDDATIILKYKELQVVVQASWCWTYSRKDAEIYGRKGIIECLNGTDMLLATKIEDRGTPLKANPLPEGRNDPFAYFAGVIRGKIKVNPNDLSALENNETVMMILEAAKHAAQTGETVIWEKFFGKDR
jgi:scyllo-inositol 2-dehydrogenase (NADP+)